MKRAAKAFEEAEHSKQNELCHLDIDAVARDVIPNSKTLLDLAVDNNINVELLMGLKRAESDQATGVLVQST